MIEIDYERPRRTIINTPFNRGCHWPREIVQKLMVLWTRGQTAREIGAELGTTRNSVLGKIHRLGLSDRIDNAKAKRDRLKEMAKERNRRPNGRKVRNTGTDVLRWAAKAPRPEPLLVDDTKPLCRSVLDLKINSCRWPLGDDNPKTQVFCGRPRIDGSSYCGYHRRASRRGRG